MAREVKAAHPPAGILLDTHIWIWYLNGDASRLKPAIRDMLDECSQQNGLFVSDMSHWEVAMKTAKGGLTLSIDPSVWLNRAARAPGMSMVSVDRDVLLMSTRLTPPLHGDPADRILLATALLHDLPLVTADRLMVAYGSCNPAVRVIDADGC
jgi:PIN domain nuclease of toxin-antitoxin system